MQFRAAVLHAPGEPLAIRTVECGPLAPDDVLVRIRAASICHTDLEVMTGELRYPMPMILGHEAAGEVAAVGGSVMGLTVGNRVALHWNPHCGTCYHCERDEPLLCEPYSRGRAKGSHFDGRHPLTLDGQPLNILMYLGGFAEYCVVPQQSAVKMPADLPFDRACLLGCGVMTGIGGAINVAEVRWGDSVAVLGCGAIGLAAVQGARLAGAGCIVAVDLDDAKLAVARSVGATATVNARTEDTVARIKALTAGRGADVVLEAAGSDAVFRSSVEALRQGGQLVWLGKVNVDREISFRWGSLMGERRIVRSSYGGAKPHRDFPMMARAYLDGRLDLDSLISGRVTLDGINEGFDRLRRGEAIRTIVDFP